MSLHKDTCIQGYQMTKAPFEDFPGYRPILGICWDMQNLEDEFCGDRL